MQHSPSVRSELQDLACCLLSNLVHRMNSYWENIVLRLVCLSTHRKKDWKTKFNHERNNEFGFMSKSRKDDFQVFCTSYCCDVEFGSKRKNAFYQHITTDNISPSFPAQILFLIAMFSQREICEWSGFPSHGLKDFHFLMINALVVWKMSAFTIKYLLSSTQPR